ncbi:MAG: MFS transporter [Firmicutes bacterium]|nr:MFS transporter [Bacillota bacterium]
MAFEPMWGVPYALYSFYQSLYMKSQGVTDQELGFLIALGFVSGAICAAFAGMITDALGRRKTTLIFDLIAWPVSILLLILADRFSLFALATILGSATRIVGVSWNLLLVEDAGPEERVAAYNLINIINISSGAVTPLAGMLIARAGIVAGERLLMAFAAVSMAAMMILRHRAVRETRIGEEILRERRVGRTLPHTMTVFYGRILEALRGRPEQMKILLASILFNLYLPIGTFASLYYAPFLTEYLRLDRSAISLLGTVNSLGILAALMMLVPAVPAKRRIEAMMLGLCLQGTALVSFFAIPKASLGWAGISVVLFASGYGLFRPFLDATLAEATEGKERAGLYALQHLAISVFSATLGSVSGFLYHLHPAALYLLSLSLLLACLALLGSYNTMHQAKGIQG